MCGKCYPITEAHKYGYDITLRFESVFNGKLHHFVPVITFSISYDKINQNEFLKHYPTPDMLTCTADKLRWYRLTNGNLQVEIADMIGIDRSTYIHYENPNRKLYELDKLQLLADSYQVNIECLLDDYMLFLYRGQGKQLKAMRRELRLTQRQFANMVGVPIGNLKHWEQEQCVMLYENYILLMDYIDLFYLNFNKI